MPTKVRARKRERQQPHRVQDRRSAASVGALPDGTPSTACAVGNAHRARIRTTMASFTFGAGNARKLLGLPLYACSAAHQPRRPPLRPALGLRLGHRPRRGRPPALPPGQRRGSATRPGWCGSRAAPRSSRRRSALGLDAMRKDGLARVLDHAAGPRHRRDPRVRRREPLRRPRRLRRAAVARPAVQAPAPRLAVDVLGLVPARRRRRAPAARRSATAGPAAGCRCSRWRRSG